MLVQEVLHLGHYMRQADWKLVFNRLKTDAPSATWIRAPGTLEGDYFERINKCQSDITPNFDNNSSFYSVAFAIQENVMEHIARVVSLDPAKVRINNLTDGPLRTHFIDFLKDTGNIDFNYSSKKI